MMTWTAPVIPARKPGWEHAYAEKLQALVDMPFSWGKGDCIARVLDLCEAMTGVNPLPVSQRRYSTAAGAAKVMKRLGFESVGHALGAVFSEVAKSKARRGDCGVADVRIAGEIVEAAFIVMGAQAVASNERGPVVIQTLQLKKTFAIGWEPPTT